MSQVCRSNNEFNEKRQELGFVFLTVGEQIQVEIGAGSGKEEKEVKGEKQFLIRGTEVTNDEVED